ncbi:MAG: flagellar biosynthetic protein FliO [Acidimicrobiales bacterium]
MLLLEFGRMILALGLVLGLLWLFSKFGRGRQGKSGGRWLPKADAGKIEVMDRRSLGRHSSIAVVRAAGRIVVVGQTPQQISVLLDAQADQEVQAGDGTAGQATAIGRPSGVDEELALPGLAAAHGADAPKAWDAFLERLREMTVRR